jgi:hypothetical protein
VGAVPVDGGEVARLHEVTEAAFVVAGEHEAPAPG